MDRRRFVQGAVFSSVACAFRGKAAEVSRPMEGQESPLQLTFDTSVSRGPLPHIWEACVGSDRAIVGLRQQWLDDLALVRQATGMRSVRFHGLFNDEMGVWPRGASAPNFLYVDMVFDAMLKRGLKPLVELSFMPAKLASGTQTIFFYRGNVTPPNEMSDWHALVRALAVHCIDRYGIEEVATWNFEVWNEPNLPYFWSGGQAGYFELYRVAALALKEVHGRLRVGGPATAQAAWVPDFLRYCSESHLPVDFVSTHIYPDDPQKVVFGQDVQYALEDVIPQALEMLRQQVAASPFPEVPLYITEWSSQNPAFIAHTLKSATGLAEMMSYWTFDNVFEELGVPKSFMNTGFGLLGMRGVPRPSFYTFNLLHRLGDEQIGSEEGPVLATRCTDGTFAVLLWNLVPKAALTGSGTGNPILQSAQSYSTSGTPRSFVLKLAGTKRHSAATITRVDAQSGNAKPAYDAMGRPPYPSVNQVENLKTKSHLAAPELVHWSKQGELSLNVPANGVALLEFA